MTRYKLTPEEATSLLIDCSRRWQVTAEGDLFRGTLWDETRTVVTFACVKMDATAATVALGEYVHWVRNTNLAVL